MLAAYRSDPAVAHFQGWEVPYSVEKAAKFIADLPTPGPPIPGEWYQIAIELKASAALIGDCALTIRADEPRQAEVGYTLARRYHGQGYATEAVTRLLDYLFTEARLHRVTAYTNVENRASIRLLERIGMRREGHFVENVWIRGAWGSEYQYGLLRCEWAGRQPATPSTGQPGGNRAS
jgi:RimJ/RimL family protein N-acetyltransferase